MPRNRNRKHRKHHHSLLKLKKIRSRLLRLRKKRQTEQNKNKNKKNTQKITKTYDNSKIALLIGCEYRYYANKGYDQRLPGCYKDVKEAKGMFINKYNMNPKNIILSTDVSHKLPIQPTLQTIKSLINRIVNMSKNDSVNQVIMYYSGHGLQVRDRNNDEKDGKDEAIVPADYRTAGFLTDDYIRQHFWSKIPSHVKQVTAIFDCCNSGSILDLPYRYKSPNILEKINNTPETKSPLVISISGCRDPQTSASAYDLERKRKWQGAMSYFLRILLDQAKHKPVHLNKLVDSLRRHLKRRKFTQIPELAFSSDIDLSQKISLF